LASSIADVLESYLVEQMSTAPN